MFSQEDQTQLNRVETNIIQVTISNELDRKNTKTTNNKSTVIGFHIVVIVDVIATVLSRTSNLFKSLQDCTSVTLRLDWRRESYWSWESLISWILRVRSIVSVRNISNILTLTCIITQKKMWRSSTDCPTDLSKSR